MTLRVTVYLYFNLITGISTYARDTGISPTLPQQLNRSRFFAVYCVPYKTALPRYDIYRGSVCCLVLPWLMSFGSRLAKLNLLRGCVLSSAPSPHRYQIQPNHQPFDRASSPFPIPVPWYNCHRKVMSPHNAPATDVPSWLAWHTSDHPICLFEVVPRNKCESSRPGSQPPHHQSAESMLENVRGLLSHRHTAFTKSNRYSCSQPKDQETYTLFYFIQATPSRDQSTPRCIFHTRITWPHNGNTLAAKSLAAVIESTVQVRYQSPVESHYVRRDRSSRPHATSRILACQSPDRK